MHGEWCALLYFTFTLQKKKKALAPSLGCGAFTTFEKRKEVRHGGKLWSTDRCAAEQFIYYLHEYE